MISVPCWITADYPGPLRLGFLVSNARSTIISPSVSIYVTTCMLLHFKLPDLDAAVIRAAGENALLSLLLVPLEAVDIADAVGIAHNSNGFEP